MHRRLVYALVSHRDGHLTIVQKQLDHYAVLGVTPAATLDELKARFRFLSHAFHPDKFGSEEHRHLAEEEFKRISTAFKTLSERARQAAAYAGAGMRPRGTDATRPGYQRQQTPPPRRPYTPRPPGGGTTAGSRSASSTRTRRSYMPSFGDSSDPTVFGTILRGVFGPALMLVTISLFAFVHSREKARPPRSAAGRGAAQAPATAPAGARAHVFDAQGRCQSCGISMSYIVKSNLPCVPEAGAQAPQRSGQPPPAASILEPKPLPKRPLSQLLNEDEVIITATQAQSVALAHFPELARAESPFKREYVQRYHAYQKSAPEYFQDLAWPLYLADEVARSWPKPY